MADPRAYMRIYTAVKARIEVGELDGRLHIGALADEFDVSRDTVQRALNMLESDGLAERWPGLGWYVKDE